MVNLPGVKMVPVSPSIALCLLLNAAVPSHCVSCLSLELAWCSYISVRLSWPRSNLFAVCAGPLIIQDIKCEAKDNT